jgi:pyruvate/2-oxoglutarate dehydrogenase complex dihydrolipoamide dehydrogenase (E3) component
VIGGGSAGLSVAAVAAQMGAETVLIEKGKMGGDCLNYGCVPSKSLLAAAHAAVLSGVAPAFGVTFDPPRIDPAGVRRHVRDIIEGIAPHDSVERFEGLGVRIIQAHARFEDPDVVAAGGTRVRARWFVLATGSSPVVPAIPGLADVAFLTNETIFDADGLPGHLVILGGGPIGVEMAQAHRRLGSAVTLIEMATILEREDPELVGIVRSHLLADGVTLHEGTRAVRIDRGSEGVSLTAIGPDGAARTIEGSHLLVATGRKPVVQDLGLDRAGIDHGPNGIVVDRRLRTTNRRVFAIGDVAGGPMFTHVALYHAGIAIRNALLRWPAKADHRTVPRVTYTHPELAQVGWTEAEARQRDGNAVRVLRWPYRENDRARTERLTEGMIKAVVTSRGRILGAGIVGAAAGELIQTWILAIEQHLSIGAVAKSMVPYPTLGEISKRAAGSFYAPRLFGPRMRAIVRLLARIG